MSKKTDQNSRLSGAFSNLGNEFDQLENGLADLSGNDSILPPNQGTENTENSKGHSKKKKSGKKNRKKQDIDNPDVFDPSDPDFTKSLIFNRTNIIGAILIVLTLGTVGIPYSMGVFSRSSAVAQDAPSDPESEENEGFPEFDLDDPQNAPNSGLYDFEYGDDSKDDQFDFQEDDYFGEQNLANSTVRENIPASNSNTPQSSRQETVRFEIEEENEPENQGSDFGMLSDSMFAEMKEDFGQNSDESYPKNTPVAMGGHEEDQWEESVSNARSTGNLSSANEIAETFPDHSDFPVQENSREAVFAVVDANAMNSTAAVLPGPRSVVNRGTHRAGEQGIVRGQSNEIDEFQDLNPETAISAQPRGIQQVQQIQPVQPVNLQRKDYQPRFVRVDQGSRSLPNNHGQLWCEYDITPYTQAIGVVPGSLPEQTIVKWILRETGEEFWHSEPFGILSANSEKLYVYHTPEMQSIVAEILDRFINPDGENDLYTFRIVSMNNPTWLSNGHAAMKSIRIDTPGVQGWLVEKEDYARIFSDIARRSDYKELCSPQFPIKNGRLYTVSSKVPKNFTKNVQQNTDIWPGYSTETSVIHEGYNLSLTPLSGADGIASYLLIKCEVLQVEKMIPVSLNVSSRATSRQRITVDSPQVAHFHLDEQICWPKDKVLLLDFGTVPMPSPAQQGDSGKLIPELSRKLSGGNSQRGNILLFVECRKP